MDEDVPPLWGQTFDSISYMDTLVRYTYPIEKSEDNSRYWFPKCKNQNANIEVVNKDSKQGNRHAIYIRLDTRESAYTS